MRPTWRPFVVRFSLVLIGACSQRAPIAEPAQTTPEVLPAASLVSDFDVLQRALEEAHGGFARYAPRADVTRRIAAHRAELTRPMTVPGFAGVVAEALAELRDGHARLELDSVTARRLATSPVLPIRVSLEEDQLIVRSNDSPTDTVLRPGMEIVRIDGRRSRDVIAQLLPKVSGDGFIETGKRARLAREFATMYWLYVDRGPGHVIEVRDRAGRSITDTVAGILERSRATVSNPVNARLNAARLKLDGPPGTVAAELIAGGTIAKIRVRAFDGDSFSISLDSAFRSVVTHDVDGMILDLRGNGGGVDQYGALLVAHFIARPFRYFERIHLPTIAPSFATWPRKTFESLRSGTTPDPAGGFLVTPPLHSGVGEQLPEPLNYRGRLVVLIDGGTFSTAADVAAQLRSHKRATFIGEETAGGYEGNTSGLNAMIVLPASGLRTKIMMYDYWNAVRAPSRRGRGTMPDYTVITRVRDLERGRDFAVERAIRVLSR